MHRIAAATLTVLALLSPRPGAAQETALTIDQALALARERAPRLVSERLRIDEARGRLAGASVFLRTNPTVEAGLGYRSEADGRKTDEGSVTVTQGFEVGGQRGARMAGARAGVSRAAADADDTARRVLRDVALAFHRALYALERVRFATETEAVAADVLRVSERRHQTGDIPRLDVNLARTSLARARAEGHAAEAGQEAALGELRILLGVAPDEPFAVRGDLRDRRRFEPDELLARASGRPDLVSLEAELLEARADRDLASASRWPELGIGASYGREEGASIGLGIVSFTLPVFERGQGPRAEASARERRVSGELQAARTLVAVEVRAALAVYRHRSAAVEELETNALPLLDQNEAQTRRSYESGQIALADLLAVRAEIIGTRLEYLGYLLEAANAAIELESSAGLLQ